VARASQNETLGLVLERGIHGGASKSQGFSSVFHFEKRCKTSVQVVLFVAKNNVQEVRNCSFCNLRKWLKNALVGHQLVFRCEKRPFWATFRNSLSVSLLQ